MKGDVAQLDLGCAIHSGVNVLISGGDYSRRRGIADEICVRSTPSRRLVVAEAAAPLRSLVPGATVFMDDVGDLSAADQSRLCGLLERFGRPQADEQDRLRLIAGTKKNLLEEVAAHRFDPTLFYRLNVIHIAV